MIQHVKKFKYLGMFLDTKLSFKEHIGYIKGKIHSNLNIFKRLAYSRMLDDKSKYRLFNAFIRPHLQSLPNFFPILMSSKQRMIEGFNRKIFRSIHLWFDARNVEIENLPKYQSISKLTNKHWDNLTQSILHTNSNVIEDYLQHKLAILYLREVLDNPMLIKERRKIFNKGRPAKNVRKLAYGNRLSLIDHILCFNSWFRFFCSHQLSTTWSKMSFFFFFSLFLFSFTFSVCDNCITLARIDLFCFKTV